MCYKKREIIKCLDNRLNNKNNLRRDIKDFTEYLKTLNRV